MRQRLLTEYGSFDVIIGAMAAHSLDALPPPRDTVEIPGVLSFDGVGTFTVYTGLETAFVNVELHNLDGDCDTTSRGTDELYRGSFYAIGADVGITSMGIGDGQTFYLTNNIDNMTEIRIGKGIQRRDADTGVPEAHFTIEFGTARVRTD